MSHTAKPKICYNCKHYQGVWEQFTIGFCTKDEPNKAKFSYNKCNDFKPRNKKKQ